MLTTPNLTVPPIEAVLAGNDTGTARLAALCLAVSRATSTALDSEMCAELQLFLDSARAEQS